MNIERKVVTYDFVTELVGEMSFIDTKFRGETYSKEKVVLNLRELTNIRR